MSRPVFYMVHPVSPPEHFLDNVKNAEKWLAWLMQNDRSRVYIAPWISEVRLVANKKMTTSYEDALADDLEVVKRQDGIILVGGRISTGMKRELDCAIANNLQVIDLSMIRSPTYIGSRKSGHNTALMQSIVLSLLRGTSD